MNVDCGAPDLTKVAFDRTKTLEKKVISLEEDVSFLKKKFFSLI